MGKKKVSFNKVVLERVDSDNIQENIRMYGKSRCGPYRLKCYTNQGRPEVISVTYNDRILGRVPDNVASKFASRIANVKKYECRFRKLIKTPESEILGLMVKIFPTPKGKSMSKEELAERARNKDKWYARYSRKWY